MKKLFCLFVLCRIAAVCTGEAEDNIQETSNNELSVSKENSIGKQEALPDTGEIYGSEKKGEKPGRKNEKSRKKKKQIRRKGKTNSDNKQRRRRKKSRESKKAKQKGKTKLYSNKRKKLRKKEKSGQKIVGRATTSKIKEKAKKTGKTQNRKRVRVFNRNKKGKRTDKRIKKVKKLKKVRTAKNKYTLERKQTKQTNYMECVAKFMLLTKMALRISINVEQQVRMVSDRSSLIGKKNAKKGDFTGTFDTLLSALGGNKSAPECDGTPITSSERGKNYKDTLTTLSDCKSMIETACGYTISQADNTTFQACRTKAIKLRSDLLECTLNKSEEAGCTCVNAITTTSAEMITCREKTLPASKDALNNKTACINDCKQR